MKKIFLFIIMIHLCAPLEAQIITTIAGIGTGGYISDGVPATSTPLYRPYTMDVDGAGNVYIADQLNGRIRKVNTAGIISTFAGTGVGTPFSGDGVPASSSNINEVDVKVKAGNIYFSDFSNNRVRVVNSAGIVNTIAGNGTMGYSGDGLPATDAALYHPRSVAFDDKGNKFIGDWYNYYIRKINSAGIISTIAGNGTSGFSGDTGPATAAQFSSMTSLATDLQGNLYVADQPNNRIRKINAITGIITTVAGSGAFGFATGTYSGDGGPATAATLFAPEGVDIDGIGNIFIADYGNSVIRKIDRHNIISTIAGTGVAGYSGNGGPAILAQLYGPQGVKVDDTGNIYIADTRNDVVRKITVSNYHIPVFTGGHVQNLTLCENTAATPVSPLLTASDGDAGQHMTWSVLFAPTHGLVIGTYSVTSTGGALPASGIFYIPDLGYSGTDTFTMRVDDDYSIDKTTIVVTVNPLPDAGTITGPDSVCAGDNTALTNTATGGTWSSSNTATCTISSTGMVTGVAAGTATITYTATNSCGTATTVYPIKVKPAGTCITGIPAVGTEQGSSLDVFPNPSNSVFTIRLSSLTTENVRIVILNALGEKMMELTTITNTEIKTSQILPAGIYYINACTEHDNWSKRATIVK